MSAHSMKDKPGEKALEALKRLDNEMTVFKAPKGRAVKRRAPKTKVLDEDTYIEEMAKIIQRDFFPDLEKLRAQNDFLDATERKDHQKLRELFIKYSSGHRPPTERYASPATFETPHSDIPGTPREPYPGSDSILRNSTNNKSKRHHVGLEDDEDDDIFKIKVSSKHSLDSYLASHTSEDNNSFQSLMEDMGRRSRARFTSQLREELDSQMKKLTACAVPPIEAQADQTLKPEELDTWSYRAKNYIMYVPDGQPAEETAAGERQQVVHCNTRLEMEMFDHQRSKETISQIAKSQERILSGRIGVDGSTLLDGKTHTGGLGGGLGGLGSGQDVNTVGTRLLPMSLAHSLVRTPSPSPGAPGESPLMTWGEIEGTPFRLDGGDTPLPGKAAGASFKMATVPKREQLALALAEKAGQRHRAMKQKAMEAAKRSMLSPSPRMATGSVTDRLASMSPAAQRLATSHLKLSGKLGASPSPHFGSRSPFPSPSARGSTPHASWPPGSTPTSATKTATPSTAKRKDSEDKKKTITDDLLQINLPKRRLKASDFFS